MIEQFEDYLSDRSDLTIKGYVSDVKQFLNVTGVTPSKVKAKHVEQYKTHLQAKGFKVVTINRKLVSVKKFIEFLNENGHQIVINIKPEKQQRQDYLDEMLTKDDFNAMVNAAEREGDTRAKALFYTLMYTGARVSEAIQLTTEQLQSDYITIKGKGSKYRDIFVSDHLKAVWSDYMKDRANTSKKLFTGQRGAINRHTVHHIIKKYAKLAGVKEERAHAHSFRHLFCLSLAEKGVSIDDIANLAGHSDINTTRIYTRKTRKQLRSVLNDHFTAAV